MISAVSTRTTSLSTQTTNLKTLITTATSNNNGVEEQISALKQANSVPTSRLSTAQRRFDSVKTRISASGTKTTAAISTAVNTETEAVSMLNTVQNFRSVSQQAAVDAANALLKVCAIFGSINIWRHRKSFIKGSSQNYRIAFIRMYTNSVVYVKRCYAI